MARYYVNTNAQSTGEHEVHKDGCHRMPKPQNRIYLGYLLDAKEAVREARRNFLMWMDVIIVQVKHTKNDKRQVNYLPFYTRRYRWF